ncbi:hypothetical protein BO224_07240 [Erysipelotrichaceae bacterium NYU-BL-E8]|uniref:Uncharacterized protein n=1 Tax=Ileibacterium valens TaxID=1862668 RepID=A0A1U7NFV5_9FIRM|nr:hypothetical protein BM735_12830 [Erysipelotrichaceae bacterium NYU-BL-F16]OLU39451.1 hypothetical protein BO222_06705 [Ileibacterium valens]OLU39515.1 hypothetical protein BO224_07240 [Erysipelotrichaceae bacterium NYU-BL-E8]
MAGGQLGNDFPDSPPARYLQTVRHIFYVGPPSRSCLIGQFGDVARFKPQTPAGLVQISLYRNLYLGKS